MKRPGFIARQSGHPSGVVGRVIAWIMARETSALNDRATELLSLQPADHVLEIGFGHGRTIERIASQITDGLVAGVDVSESMTRLATRRNQTSVVAGRVDLRNADSATLPFADAAFDKALSVHTLYFWSDPAACFREIRRVLRPGGCFVLGFTRKGSTRTASFPADVYTFYDEEDVERMLMDAGFRSVEILDAGEAALACARPCRRQRVSVVI